MTNRIKCEGCAFNSGTTANRNTWTQIDAQLCVETRTPFYCHDAPEKISKQGFTQDESVDIAEQDGSLRLCAGYVDAVKMLSDSGFYENHPEWKVKVQQALLRVVEKALHEPMMSEEEAHIYLLSEMERVGINIINHHHPAS